jgi:RecB family exonuclease
MSRLADGFQASTLAGVQDGGLALVGTARLARALSERWRAGHMAAGRDGWDRGPIRSLRAWAHDRWADGWPETWPAPNFLLWHQWTRLTEDDPPPGDLTPGPPLTQALDQAYTLVVEHVPDPLEADPASALVQWRRRLSARLDDALQEAGLFHPARLLNHVAQGLDSGRLPPPENVIWAGFDFPSSSEESLRKILARRGRLTRLTLPGTEYFDGPALALTDRKQEVFWVAGQVVRAARDISLDRIGLVIPDTTAYGALVERALNQILGPNGAEFYFRMTPRLTLADRPLVRAGLAPLRAASRPVEPADLLDLIDSPYFTAWQKPVTDRLGVDHLWRKRDVFGSVRNFVGVLDQTQTSALRLAPEGRSLDAVLEPLLGGGRRPLAAWTEDLRRVWAELGLDVPEEDRADENALDSVLTRLAKDLGGLAVDREGFRDWLEAALQKTPAPPEGIERAGVQVMLAEEARGLAFDRLFVLGLDGRSWPRPVRPLPLLSPAERSQVLGQTPQSEYRFSKRTLEVIMAGAREVTLTRPENDGDEPLPASILWPGDTDRIRVAPWLTPDPAWLRARVFCDGWQGRAQSRPDFMDRPAPGLVPEKIRVTSLEAALTCPSRFLAQVILGLEPLEEPQAGVTPRERGSVLHRVLQAFTSRLRTENIDLESNEAETRLVECVDQVLGRKLDDPTWLVERSRWLDDPGVLKQWLEVERDHRRQGWRTIGEEMDFTDLVVDEAGLSLTGRIDRIDLHDQHGILCWDYKTGRVPGGPDVFDRLLEPQLPAYVEALRQGACLLPESCRPATESGQIRAAYFELSSFKNILPKLLDHGSEDWSAVAQRLREVLGELFAPLHDGLYPARPSEILDAEKTCQDCPYRLLCPPEAGEEGS